MMKPYFTRLKERDYASHKTKNKNHDTRKTSNNFTRLGGLSILWLSHILQDWKKETTQAMKPRIKPTILGKLQVRKRKKSRSCLGWYHVIKNDLIPFTLVIHTINNNINVYNNYYSYYKISYYMKLGKTNQCMNCLTYY